MVEVTYETYPNDETPYLGQILKTRIREQVEAAEATYVEAVKVAKVA